MADSARPVEVEDGALDPARLFLNVGQEELVEHAR